jgi:hypothetical protein
MAYADVSLASTSTTNPVFGAPTNFYFGSWVSSSGNNDLSARNSESATAALGNAQNQSQAGGQGEPGLLASLPQVSSSALGNIPPVVLYGAAGAFVLLLVVIIWKK